MTAETRPLADVTHDAIRLFSRGLGVVETARFLGQFGAGRGNYTEERAALFGGVSLDALIEETQRIGRERGA